jgi:hypothetical protein
VIFVETINACQHGRSSIKTHLFLKGLQYASNTSNFDIKYLKTQGLKFFQIVTCWFSYTKMKGLKNLYHCWFGTVLVPWKL